MLAWRIELEAGVALLGRTMIDRKRVSEAGAIIDLETDLPHVKGYWVASFRLLAFAW